MVFSFKNNYKALACSKHSVLLVEKKGQPLIFTVAFGFATGNTVLQNNFPRA
jgi:hypothetical protein